MWVAKTVHSITMSKHHSRNLALGLGREAAHLNCDLVADRARPWMQWAAIYLERAIVEINSAAALPLCLSLRNDAFDRNSTFRITLFGGQSL